MKRVYADMVGDLFHAGHLNMLRQAREFGDYLIVGVHSDSTVESYKGEPILRQEERYEIIRNCRLVDEIIEDAPTEITKEYLAKHKVDVVVHGDDTNPGFAEQHKVPIEMGIMKYVPYTEGISTSEIISRVKKRT